MGVHIYTNGAWTDSGRIYRNSLNLFDISTITLGKYIDSQGQEIESTAQSAQSRLNHTDYIEVISGEPYIYSYVNGVATANTIALCWLDEQKELISRDTLNVNDSSYKLSAIAPGNAKYCIINFTGYPVSDSCLRFNHGSVTLPYEPYNVVDWYTNNGHNYSSGAWS